MTTASPAMEIDAYKRAPPDRKKTAKGGWDTLYTSSGTIKDLDTDGDGYVTVAEYEAGSQGQVRRSWTPTMTAS